MAIVGFGEVLCSEMVLRMQTGSYLLKRSRCSRGLPVRDQKGWWGTVRDVDY